ncbi:hypothetical protein PBI_ARCHERS7_237 [Mycobacterium phage ArcherS7]|uniref:Uncharacterized protein n=23 Tax=Bixzunavirus TaxID=680114 RepID=Q852Y2_BPMBZ|nr:gp223 [Mycobacterium phage Bxz1]YP_002224225.1 hypothetical protein SCOTTMCG_228 [Mycobacterium phage ScottMcG]YP_002224448.1 gp229 [Mycobacterium phage Spud]YP_002224889.1 gp226 [Mycobacterium phage Rizal]YP_008061006.1 hypothetical protein M181_gp121 [Mycobacterium phage Gizmo]YP_008061464.1 hypothetical protein M180_gp116 [Mycobacterium phage ArcherS7]YP_008061694.1 hypothetical protein M182_gp116 [Mycobacterium phage Astraea]YP_009017534.1 hypothetical protein MOMOMIXON_232 [Mycobacte
MKLNRQKMLDLIETIEADAERRAEEWVEAEKAFRVQERKDWVESNKATLRALRDLLSLKLKNGGVVVREELQALGLNSRWGDPEVPSFAPTTLKFTYKGKEYPPSKPVLRADSPLLDLKAALQTVTDEEVSTSALASMGFRNLEWFWRRVKEAQA